MGFRWKSPFRLLFVCWVMVLLYGQVGVHFVHSCRFSGGGVRLLIVADPQLTDHFSYDVSPFLNWVIGFFCDLQLRMSWKAAVWQADPDAAVFLGDMLWGGFLFSSEQEYQLGVARLNAVFGGAAKNPKRHGVASGSTARFQPSIPSFVVCGNHDVW